MDPRMSYRMASARMGDIERGAALPLEAREAIDAAGPAKWRLVGWLRRSRPEPVAEPAPLPVEQAAPAPRIAA